ncbi:DUF2795 domain-containing protein [Actinomadura atramentaria]|uniref:DUF2795 domain-containing protein n=1 Tax=Actinomadura atramentaria TaxID=1990 RepID=UPI00036261AB|nr:DUF2795 domain-containing protein [Actinomadura atramentaria]
MTEQQTGKHGPHLDDELERETRGMVNGGHSTHAEEWKETEPVSDDPVWHPGERPDPMQPRDPLRGSPPGMTAGDVDGRSALARMLTGVRYPARPDDLAAHLRAGESDEAAEFLRDLPDRPYENLADVAEELGYGREERF